MLTLLGCLLVPAVVAGLNSILAGPLWIHVAGVVLGVAALVRWGRKPGQEETGTAIGYLLILTALTLCVAMGAGARSTVLDAWGHPTTVRVAGLDIDQTEHRGRIRYEYCYQLTHPGGSPVRGEICRDGQDLYLWRETTVLIGPGGLIGPDTPESVEADRPWRYVALGSLALLIILCWIATRFPTDRPAPRPARPRSPATVPNRADRRRAGRISRSRSRPPGSGRTRRAP